MSWQAPSQSSTPGPPQIGGVDVGSATEVVFVTVKGIEVVEDEEEELLPDSEGVLLWTVVERVLSEVNFELILEVPSAE